MRKRLSIVVLNYRTAGLTIDCLRSLEGQVEPDRDSVVVVDNGSGDGSFERLQRWVKERGWNGWIRLVRSEVNLGFPGGCNIGIKAVDADAYWLLNNDTLILPGAVSSLLEAMREHPEAGISSSAQEWPDGTPQTCCFRFRTPIGELVAAAAIGPLTRLFGRHVVALPPPYQVFEPDWTCFASVLIRREVIDQVGLLDDGYFNYFDDEDYCRRAHRAGWRVLHWPEARVVHLEGGSQQVESLKAARRRRPSYYYASRARYFAKFHGRLGLWCANLLWSMGRAISWTRERLGRKQPHVCEKEWLDIWSNWRNPMRPPVREEVSAPDRTMAEDRARSIAASERANSPDREASVVEASSSERNGR